MSKKLILVLVLALFGSTAFLRAATTDPNAELTTLTYVAPADMAQNVSGNVVLSWIADENATEYQLYFGSTYPPQLLVDWTPITSPNCSYNVSNLIENNTHYFWIVSIRNNASTLTGETWGFTTVLSVPYNVEATVEQLYPGDTTMIKWKSPVSSGGFSGEFTACDGTSTSSYIPVYGMWMDDYTKSEMIYPAEMLEEMNGGEITSLKYYISSPAAALWAPAAFNVYMTEVDATSMSSYSNSANAEIVYTGQLDGTGTEMVIEFDQPYVYHGGNLLVGFEQTAVGTWKSASFYGIESPGSSSSGYSSASASAATFNQRNFLPKTTFVCGGKNERSLRGFNLYVDGVKANNTYITENRYFLNNLTYNTNPGHEITVTCVYDEGESNPSTPAIVKVTGNGTISGSVRDVMTGDFLAGANVTFYGTDEFDNSVSYTATTNNNGIYNMQVLAGMYNRAKAEHPEYGVSFDNNVYTVNYNMTTTVDFRLHEAFNPVYKVYAEDYDGGTMAKITWSLNDFETPGGGGGGGGSTTPTTYDFENGTLMGWTSLDADNDGFGWNTSTSFGGYNNSTGLVYSQSYDNTYGVLYPDNYLISPAKAEYPAITFYACAQDASYAQEHFGVAVSTGGATAADFTTIQEWTMSAKSVGAPTSVTRSGNRAQGTWREYTVDLSAYAGQDIWVAIRHFNCSDWFYLDVDDITLGGTSKDRGVEYYTLYRKAILKENLSEADSIVLNNHLTDTLYADFSWFNAAPGLYQYGVSAVYPELPSDKGSRDELTVYEGTSTNNHVPMYVFYFDDWARSQYIIPADDLSDMSGGIITALKYYTTSSSIPYTTLSTVDFYITEVPNTTISAYIDKNDAQVVYTGTVDFTSAGSNGEAVITFDTPYQYNGGNLLIGCDNLTDAGYKNIYFYGQDVSGASISGSDGSSSAAAPATNQDFIPMTTFFYTPGTGGNDNPVTEITWSNILPKNMETTITVSAQTNVGDYTGTTVTLENIKEDYTYTAVLDTANSVTFTDFRRGDYKLTVALDGFSSNYDNTEVGIWEESEFSAYLEELLIPVNEVIVSGTGFARWSDLLPQTDVAQLYHVVCNDVFQGEITENYMQINVDNLTVGETYPVQVAVRYSTGLSPFTTGYFTYIGCDAVEQQIEEFNAAANCMDVVLTWNGGSNPPTPPTPPTGEIYDFEDGTMQGWTSLDADNDGFGWNTSTSFGGHNSSTGLVYSQSYDNTYGVLYPDNYLISPAKAEYPAITFYACAQDASYAQEHFGVAVSTGGATAADFTTIQEWTMSAKSVGAPTSVTRSGNRAQGTWREYTVDLSAYAGQDIWVAIRHFNCSDWFYLDVDDIALGDGGNPNPPTPPTPGDVYDFEDGSMQGWTSLDADNDGFGWNTSTSFGGHNSSTGLVYSQSYDNTYGVLYPDNYLISPAKAEYPAITFYACAQDASYAQEHFGVAVSTGGATAADFTTIQEWTMSAKSVGAPTSVTRSGNRAQGSWYQYTVDLSAYAGQDIWVAIRHFNCSDWFYLDVDDISLATPEKRGAEGVEACGTMIVTDAVTDMWDLQGTVTCSSAGQQAVATDGNFIYTASWQDAPTGGYTFYKYDMSGSFVEGFNISGASGIRDLAFDGNYFYGTSGAATLFILDLANKTMAGTINCAGATTRHCSYDPEQDGFWVGNWSDLYFYDRNGVRQFTAPAPSSAYGSGYFKDENGESHLFLFCQPNSDAKVYDYNITTNTMGTSPVCDFGTLPGYNQGIAGGAFIANYNNLTCYFGNIQQDPNLIGIYELGAAGSGGGVIGATTYTPNKYNILVDGVVVGATAENTFTVVAEDTEEHLYQVVYVDGNYNISCPAEAVIAAGNAQTPYDLAGEYVWGEDAFGANITWSYGVAAETDFHYDNGTAATSIGEGDTTTPFWYGIMIPAEDLAGYEGATLNKVAFYEYNVPGTYTILIHQGGDNAPGELVYSQDVEATGTMDWNEAELDTPVEIDPTQNLWIIMYNVDVEYPGVCAATTGNPNGRWLSEDGENWYDMAAFGFNYDWMVRGFVTNPNGGTNLVDPTGFNVYRNNQVITTVPYTGEINYSYFDNVAAGNYTYQVSAVYSNTCESDYALTVDESTNYVEVNVTSVTDINDNVALYPNPTNGMVTIEAAGMNHITVVSTLGQVVYDAEVNADMTQLNLGQFKAGIYMVRISTENGIGVKRVTVVK